MTAYVSSMASIHRLRPASIDVLAAAVCVLLPLLSPFRADIDAATGWTFTLVTALPLLVRRFWPVAVFVWALIVACVGLSLGLGSPGFLGAAYAIYMLATTRGVPTARIAAWIGGVSVLAAAVLAVGGGQRYDGGTGPIQLVLGLAVVGAACAAGTAVRERHEGMRRTIAEEAARAMADERLRLARDVHDVVTHSVGLIAVKASVANHVLVDPPDEARNALTDIEQVSRKALQDLRGTLAVLRGDGEGEERQPVPTLDDLPEVVATAESAGVRVELRVDDTDGLPAGLTLSAFRIVQEALTNVAKHAAPTGCRVNVRTCDGALCIDVVDDGANEQRPPAVTGSGAGLTGMKERAAAHGGSLEAGKTPQGGFGVRAVLPY